MCDETERLDRIVSNLLSLSRIEAGALKPERQAVPLEELVADRIRRLSALLRRVRIQVELPAALPLVDADYTQLDLVVTNLLENAARHAREGSCVRIGGRQLDGLVEVRVADEGIGVPEHARSSIFEPCRQGERGGSSGVCLAICKAVIEGHGGTIASIGQWAAVRRLCSPCPSIAPPAEAERKLNGRFLRRNGASGTRKAMSFRAAGRR